MRDWAMPRWETQTRLKRMEGATTPNCTAIREKKEEDWGKSGGVESVERERISRWGTNYFQRGGLKRGRKLAGRSEDKKTDLLETREGNTDDAWLVQQKREGGGRENRASGGLKSIQTGSWPSIWRSAKRRCQKKSRGAREWSNQPFSTQNGRVPERIVRGKGAATHPSGTLGISGDGIAKGVPRQLGNVRCVL